MEKEFVYLVESNEGDSYDYYRTLIGVAKTEEKAKEIANDFNQSFVEDFMEMPMSADFFNCHVGELIDNESDDTPEYRDYLGYTAKQWKDMEDIAKIIDYGYTPAFISRVELQ